MTDQLTIFEAIPRIMEELPPIAKDSEMKQGERYRFRSIDDIIPEIERLFAKYGVFAVPLLQPHTDEVVTSRSGNPMRRVVLKGSYFLYAADGSRIPAQTMGEAIDVGDKSHNKAMTAAYKYMLTQVFNINAGDDPDHYRPELENQDDGRVKLERDQKPSWRNYDALRALGPLMAVAGIDEQVKAWAHDQDIDLAPGRAEERLGAVVEHARHLLSERLTGSTTPVEVIPADPQATAEALARVSEAFPGTVVAEDPGDPEGDDSEPFG